MNLIQSASTLRRLFVSLSAVLTMVVGISASLAETPVAAVAPTAGQASETALPAKSLAGFYHPGVLVNRAQLDLIKAKVAAGAEPWKTAFEATKTSDYGALTYTPHPWKTCE